MQSCQTGNSFPTDKWFEHIFGAAENPKSINSQLECIENEDGIALIHSKINDKTYQAGNFQVRTVSSFQDLKPRGGGKLSVLQGEYFRGKSINPADILACQSIAENNGATFLAASNFNCLEFVSSYGSATHGVTNYIYDCTQGPYCAIATAASIVYRNYFVKHDGVVGQLEKEVELLKNTPIEVTHGYPSIEESEIDRLKSLDFNWGNYDNFPVGVHRDCQVTMTRGNNGFVEVVDKQIVHHVYAAALNFAGSVTINKFTKEIGQHLLTAEYRATVLAAWENSLLHPELPGSNKLYLTLLGGGVFGNPYEMIFESILSNLDVIVDSGLEVIIVFYYTPNKDLTEPIFKAVEKTGGRSIK